jgi:hypothetical protein
LDNLKWSHCLFEVPYKSCPYLQYVIENELSFIQDYLHLAWGYTYGTKKPIEGRTKSKMLDETNKVNTTVFWISVYT